MSKSWAKYDLLSAEEAALYGPIIVDNAVASKDYYGRPYESDADLVFHFGTGMSCSFTVHLASLYTVFMPEWLKSEKVTCIVNMAGLGQQGLEGHYWWDLEKWPEEMENVKKLGGDMIEGLLVHHRKDSAYAEQFYKTQYDIDFLSIEGVNDSWDYDISAHFGEIAAFLNKHVAGREHAKIVINC